MLLQDWKRMPFVGEKLHRAPRGAACTARAEARSLFSLFFNLRSKYQETTSLNTRKYGKGTYWV